MMVTVGRHEWFVFRRYAEFDKLYNIVSDHNKIVLAHVDIHKHVKLTKSIL